MRTLCIFFISQLKFFCSHKIILHKFYSHAVDCLKLIFYIIYGMLFGFALWLHFELQLRWCSTFDKCVVYVWGGFIHKNQWNVGILPKERKLYRNFLSLHDCLLNKLFPICTFNLNIFLSPLILLRFWFQTFCFCSFEDFFWFLFKFETSKNNNAYLNFKSTQCILFLITKGTEDCFFFHLHKIWIFITTNVQFKFC